jgi:alcohol dehydrogenase
MKELDFFVPARILLGSDTLSRLGSVAEGLGSRALLVADSILSEGPLPERISGILEQKGIKLLMSTGVPADAFHDHTDEYVSLAKAGQCQIIIGLGGIRTLSIAKATAALAGGNRRADDLMDGFPSPAKKLKYIEIPTTCRNPFMLKGDLLLVDSRNRKSQIISIPDFAPNLVVMDSRLAASLSDKYAFATLMDTFLYTLEGLVSNRQNFLSESLFLKAAAQLVQAQALSGKPEGAEAFRDYAFQGGMTAALGLSMSCLGFGSALSFVLAGRLGLPKSLLGAMVLPEVLQWAARTAPDKIMRLAPILAADTRGMDPVKAAARTAELLLGLFQETIGSIRLENISLTRDAAADLADSALSLPFCHSGPGAVSQGDLLGIIRRTF